MKRINKGRASRQPRLQALIILGAVSLLAFAGYTSASYVLQRQQAGLASAARFYFTSDYLREAEENASYYLDSQAGSFKITLSNAEDTLRSAAEEISYDVTVTGGTAAPTSGTLPGGSLASAKIIITPDKNQEKIIVTATSGTPYQKTLTATFRLTAGSSYTLEDGTAAAVLTMTCTAAVPVTLVLPEDVIPDATDRRVTKENGQYIFTPSSEGIYSLVLLKSDSALSLTGNNVPFTDTIDLTSSP